MSSIFIPPKVGDIASITSIILSGSCVLSTIGTQLIHANSLNNTDFPSMTGRPANPQIFHNPRTALPSLTIAIVLDFQVYSYAFSGFFAISRQGCATQGV